MRVESDWQVGKAEPREGSACAFPQEVVHEGAPVGRGCEKVIIRTDVVYTREPKLHDDERGREAFRMLQAANEAEANDDPGEAVKYYKRARSLCPELTSLCGF